MNVIKLLLVISLAFLGFNACDSKKSDTQVREVHWDRDMCERCKMVVSDRHHAVQVINPQTHKAYMYDDLGCSVLWFKEEKIAWEDRAVIWITDAKSGQWIDARKAYYDAGNITPMAFGFAAHLNKDDIKKGKKVLLFKEVKQKIIEIKKEKMKKKKMKKGEMH
jgi:nitrous oxide reductase accessory protein NosL